MSLRAMLKTGHTPTLASAFLYFDLSFMVWVILGPLAVLIGPDLHLNAAQKGLMVATPSLSAALLRAVNGMFVDRFGAKTTGIVSQLVVVGALIAAWWFGIHSFAQILILGLALGVAGASFAIVIPMTSSWYPPQYQGLALGIAGAGNSGTVLAALFAPALAIKFGWTNVLGLAVIPLSVAFLLFVVCAKDSPSRRARTSARGYLSVVKQGDAWGLMAVYTVTFGGFSGLASSLPIYFNTQYGLSAVSAGLFTAACILAGSAVRPFGGWVADRIGGVRTLVVMLPVAAGAFCLLSLGLADVRWALAVTVAGMLALGMGNGAVFQLVPQRFGNEIGQVTGLVGMCGGIGGFYLASSLGYSKQLTGSYSDGLLIFAGLSVAAMLGLLVRQRWGGWLNAALAQHHA